MPGRPHAVRSTRDPTRWAGQSAWGWRATSDGTFERDEYEENVVAVVRHMRQNGHTIRQIVEFLHGLGVVSRRGTPIGMTRVFEMIHGAKRKVRVRHPSR
jgi:hypothetical protein